MKKLILVAMTLVCVFLTSCNKEKDQNLKLDIFQTCKVPSGTTLMGNIYVTDYGIIYDVEEDGHGVYFKKYLDDNNQVVIEKEGKYIKVKDWGSKAKTAETLGQNKLLWENVTYKNLEFYRFHLQLIELQPEPLPATDSSN